MVEETKIPEGYKKTEVGVIPEDWEVVRLKDISKTISSGKSRTKSRDGIYPIYGSTGIIGFDNKYDYQGNKILIARVGANAGTINSANGKYNVSDNTLIIDLEHKQNLVYIKYFLSSINLNKLVFGSGQPLITGGQLKDITIIAPRESSEQQAISTAITDVDNLITSIEKLIDKKEKIKQGTMQELLTGKRRLPGFSGEWEVKKLGDIAKVTMGQSPASEYYNLEMEGLPLFQGNADMENRKTIIRFYTKQVTKRCYKDDIIMTVRAPVGAIGKATTDGCIGRGVCAIRYINDYLYQYLILIEDKWSQFSKGSTFDSINSKEVLGLNIYIPSDIEEQQAIAQILGDMDSEIEALNQKLDKYKIIKQGMMQELLTGRIRLI